MKRDVTAQAITDLDDEWIGEARTIRPARRRGAVRWLAAAACLLLVVSGGWLLRPEYSPELQLHGMTVEKTPLPISGGIALQTVRGIDDQERIEVALFADASHKTEIRVSAGTIRPADEAEETGAAACTVQEPTQLLWVIEDGASSQSYELTAGGRTFLLRYDESLMDWTLQEK